MKQKKFTIILGAVLVIIIAIFAALSITNKPQTTEGKKQITVTIVYSDKTEKDYKISTEAEFLGDALKENDLVTEEEYKSGYYTIIDGVTADYNKDKAWWCVTQSDEMTSVGINELTVADGDTYKITYTIN